MENNKLNRKIHWLSILAMFVVAAALVGMVYLARAWNYSKYIDGADVAIILFLRLRTRLSALSHCYLLLHRWLIFCSHRVQRAGAMLKLPTLRASV